MQYIIETLEPVVIIGKERCYDLADADVSKKIKVFWHEVFAENLLKQIPAIKKQGPMFGVYNKYDQDGNYSLMIGCPVVEPETIPAELTCLAIPTAKYAVFLLDSVQPGAIADFWRTLWEQKDTIGFERAFTFDFELYEKALDGTSIVKVFIAIK